MKFLGHHPQSPPLIYPSVLPRHPRPPSPSPPPPLLPPLPPPPPALPPPPPTAFCPSVSNLHSPPLALLTPARLSIHRLLRVLIPQRRHPPNNPVVRLARFHAHACPLVRVSRVRRGGRSGGGEGETKRPPLTSAHGVRRPRDTK